MRINRIEILNFGPFHDKHEIELQGDGAGVHIFRGNNGQGKTSFQRSVLWALYGKIVDRKGKEIRPTSLLNKEALEDDIYQFGVTLFFEHDGQSWSIHREMKANRHQDKRYKEGMTLDVVNEGKVVKGPENTVQRILPGQISRFYFFDAEMLRDYEELLEGEKHAVALLKDSIERVLGVPHFKTARDDLDAVRKKIERERNKLIKRLGGKDFEELAKDLEFATQEIENKEATIDDLNERIEELELEIRDKKRRLTDLAEVKDLAEKRIRLEGEIKTQEGKREAKLGEIQNLAANLYKTILIPSAESVISRLENKSREALDRYDKKQQAVKKATELEKSLEPPHKCSLCGNEVDEKTLRQLDAELEETRLLIEELTQVPEPNLEFEHHKDRLEQMASQAVDRDELESLGSELREIDRKLASIESRLSDTEEKLGEIDADEPMRLELEIQEWKGEVGRLRGILQKEKEELARHNDWKGDLERRMAIIPEGEIDILNRRIDLVKEVKEVFQDAVAFYREKRRKDVESLATEVFQEIRSKEYFDRLEINEDYGLSIITSSGSVLDRSEWRSAGEEQLVALALIGALNKCAQAEAPVFMDGPFVRLDLSHGERVLKYLPELADQIVLLVTDREFQEGDERHLEGNIKSDYTIVNRGEKEGSFIFPTSSEEAVS